ATPAGRAGAAASDARVRPRVRSSRWMSASRSRCGRGAGLARSASGLFGDRAAWHELLAGLLGGLELGAVGIDAGVLADLECAAGLRIRELGHPVRAHALGVREHCLLLFGLLRRCRPSPVRQELLTGLLGGLEPRRANVDADRLAVRIPT